MTTPVAGAVLAASLLSGCSFGGMPDASYRVPRVEIQPATVRAGGSISIAVDSGCDVDTPEGGWELIAAPVGLREAVRIYLDRDLADGFTAELRLPEDFPPGEAFAGIDGWDFSECLDAGSCASPTSGFVVTGVP